MSAGSVQHRTLQKALAVAGSLPALARILRVPSAELALWLEGSAEVPTSVFLNVVDYLLEQPASFVSKADGRPIEGEAPPKNGSEDN